MPEEYQSWWQNLSPEARAYVLDGAIVVGALLGGHIFTVMVARFLRARRFNWLFRAARPAPDYLEDERSISPTSLAGHLVRLTVWAGAAWWLAREHGRPDLAETIMTWAGRIWAVVASLAAALALAGLLARRVIECLEGVNAPASNRAGAPGPRNLAGAVAAAIYGVVLILTLLTVADYFNWTLTRNAAASLWQLALHLLTAGAAVLIGWLGARWARDLATNHAPTAQEQTAVGIVAVTTALAVALLIFGAGLGLGVAFLAVVVGLAFLARGHLPDVMAGLKLRKGRVESVWFNGVPYQLGQIGLTSSTVGRGGEVFKVPNRQLLEAAGQTAHETARQPVLTR